MLLAELRMGMCSGHSGPPSSASASTLTLKCVDPEAGKKNGSDEMAADTSKPGVQTRGGGVFGSIGEHSGPRVKRC